MLFGWRRLKLRLLFTLNNFLRHCGSVEIFFSFSKFGLSQFPWQLLILESCFLFGLRHILIFIYKFQQIYHRLRFPVRYESSKTQIYKSFTIDIIRCSFLNLVQFERDQVLLAFSRQVLENERESFVATIITDLQSFHTCLQIHSFLCLLLHLYFNLVEKGEQLPILIILTIMVQCCLIKDQIWFFVQNYLFASF